MRLTVTRAVSGFDGSTSQRARSSRVPVTGFDASTAWSFLEGTADYNGDGKSDVLLRNDATGSLSLWLMNGPSIAAADSFVASADR